MNDFITAMTSTLETSREAEFPEVKAILRSIDAGKELPCFMIVEGSPDKQEIISNTGNNQWQCITGNLLIVFILQIGQQREDEATIAIDTTAKKVCKVIKASPLLGDFLTEPVDIQGIASGKFIFAGFPSRYQEISIQGKYMRRDE